jgi:hypothetical protein
MSTRFACSLSSLQIRGPRICQASAALDFPEREGPDEIADPIHTSRIGGN